MRSRYDVTLEEFAAAYRVTHQTARRICRLKLVDAIKVGKGWLLNGSTLDRMMALKFGNAAARDLAKKHL